MYKIKDLGKIKQNKKVKIEFNISSNNNYTELISSCGCTKPVLEGNKIVVMYTPKSVPIHLKDRGFYYDEKTIKAYNAKGDVDIFKFKAKVYK